MERGIDLNEQLIVNKLPLFFPHERRCHDRGWNFSGDILIVDRSIKPLSGKLIVAVLDGELLVRTAAKKFQQC
jgi:DNA polymerase V